MELFSEIYSTYYNAVRHVLREGAEKPLSFGEVQRILAENAFSESVYHMLPKLQSGVWPLLSDTGNGYSAACRPLPENPLTYLQRAWLGALLRDPRIRLFLDPDEIGPVKSALGPVPPLYEQDDFYVFDRARDGDDYENEEYRRRFRVFLDAVHHKSAVSVHYEGGKGRRLNSVFWPYRLEYSDRDDKFRALCYRMTGMRKLHYVLNLGRVVTAKAAEVRQNVNDEAVSDMTPKAQYRTVTLEITRERNALERCMVQFAHFEKRTEYDEAADRYTCTVKYNVMDETALVIRVLSFGPTVRVLEPAHFVEEIRSRVEKQIALIRQHNDKERI